MLFHIIVVLWRGNEIDRRTMNGPKSSSVKFYNDAPEFIAVGFNRWTNGDDTIIIL